MHVFFSLSNNVLPCKRVCDKEDLVNSSNVGSILFKVLKRVYRSSLNVGQWIRKCAIDELSFKNCINKNTLFSKLLVICS